MTGAPFSAPAIELVHWLHCASVQQRMRLRQHSPVLALQFQCDRVLPGGKERYECAVSLGNLAQAVFLDRPRFPDGGEKPCERFFKLMPVEDSVRIGAAKTLQEDEAVAQNFGSV